MTTVVDASVVLAWLQNEPGADEAEPMLMEGVIGAANWSEVLQKARQHGAPAAIVARLLATFGLRVEDVTARDAERAAGCGTRAVRCRSATGCALRSDCGSSPGGHHGRCVESPGRRPGDHRDPLTFAHRGPRAPSGADERPRLRMTVTSCVRRARGLRAAI